MAKRYHPLNFEGTFKPKKPRTDNVIHFNQVVRINGTTPTAKINVVTTAGTSAVAVIDDDLDDLQNLNLPDCLESFNFTTNSFSQFQRGAPQCSTQDQVYAARNNVPASTNNVDDDLDDDDCMLSQLNIEKIVAPNENQGKKNTFLAPKPAPLAARISDACISQQDQKNLAEIRRQKAAEQKTKFLEKKLEELRRERCNNKLVIEELKEKLQGKDGEMLTFRYENENLKLQNEKLKLDKMQEAACVTMEWKEQIKALQGQLLQKENEIQTITTKKRKESEPRPMDFLQIAKLCVPKTFLFKEFHVQTDVWYGLESFDTGFASPEIINLIKLQTIIGLLQRSTHCDVQHLEKATDIILSTLENTEIKTQNLKKFNISQYTTSPAYVDYLLRNVAKTTNKKLKKNSEVDVLRPHSYENLVFDEKAIHVISYVFLSRQFCAYLQSKPVIFSKILEKFKNIVKQILTTANIGEQCELVASLAAILQNLTSNLLCFGTFRTDILEIFQLISHCCVCNIDCVAHLTRFLYNYSLSSPEHIDQLCNGRPEMKQTYEKMIFDRNCCGLMILGAKLKDTVDIICKRISSFSKQLTDICFNLVHFILSCTRAEPQWLKTNNCKCLIELTAGFLSTLFQCMNIFAKDFEALEHKKICQIAQSGTILLHYLFGQTSAKDTWKCYPELKDCFAVSTQMIQQHSEVLELQTYHLKCFSMMNIAVITSDVPAMQKDMNESTGEMKVHASIDANFTNWRRLLNDN